MNEWEWQLLEDKTPLESLEIMGVRVRRGDSVKLRPRAGGDIFDLALNGKLAAIESIEQDYEGKLHVCVVLDDDPGRDIGLMRQPGPVFSLHRANWNSPPTERRCIPRKPKEYSSPESATFFWRTTASAWK